MDVVSPGPIPRLIWWITGMQFVLMVAWGLFTPVFHATDEPNQYDAVMYVRDNHSWPRSRTTRVQPGTVRAIAQSPFGSARDPYDQSHAPVTGRTPVPRSERPSFRGQNGPLPQGMTGGLQQLTQHPPGYYFLGAAVLAATPSASGWNWDQQVGYLRMLSALLLAPVPALAYASVRRLTDRPGPAIAGALLPLCIPAFEFLGGTVNNDVLITALAAPVTYLSIRVMTGDVRRRTVLGLGLFEGLACLSKVFSVALLPLMALAFLIAWRAGTAGRVILPRAAACFAVAFACGGWWWVLTLYRYGSLTAHNGEGAVKTPVGTWYSAKVLDRRWWSYLGWSDASFGNRTVLVLTLVAGIGLLAAVLLGSGRRRDRLSGPALLVPVVFLYLFVLHRFSSGWLGTGARYAYAALPATVVLIAVGWGRLAGRWDRILPVLVLAAGGGLEAWAVLLCLRAWWRPTAHGSVESFAAWSPWPPWVLWLVGALTVAGIAAGGFSVARWTIRAVRADAGPAAPVAPEAGELVAAP